MDRHDAVHGRSNPEAAADPSADDAGSDEQLRPAAQQPTVLHGTATTGRRAKGHGADVPSGFGAVDAAGPKTAAGLPADVPTVAGAGHGTTAGLPGSGSAVSGSLHGYIQPCQQVGLYCLLKYVSKRPERSRASLSSSP